MLFNEKKERGKEENILKAELFFNLKQKKMEKSINNSRGKHVP